MLFTIILATVIVSLISVIGILTIYSSPKKKGFWGRYLERLEKLLSLFKRLSTAIAETSIEDSCFEGLHPAEDPPFSWFEFDLKEVVGRLGGLDGEVGECARVIIEVIENDDRTPILKEFHNERIQHINGMNLYLKTPLTIGVLNEINKKVKRTVWSEDDVQSIKRGFGEHPYRKTRFARVTGWDKALMTLLSR